MRKNNKPKCNADAAETVISLLEKAGYEAYLVGGCVRDRLLGKEAADIDITTNALPDQMFRVLGDYRTVGTGLRHGTITVIVDQIPVEVTTYRVDGQYSDNRRPDSVFFTSELKEDLARRDFTINAMAFSKERGIVDPFGGSQDLEAGLIRCVGNPGERFAEDGLRILRALRFAAVLGFEIESGTKAAIFAEKQRLNHLAAERIWIELKKLLCGRKAAEIILEYIEVLGVVIPEMLPMKGFEQNNAHHIYDVLEHTAKMIQNTPAEPCLRTAALFHDIGKPLVYTEDEDGTGHFYGHSSISAELAEKILLRLKVDTGTRKAVVTLVQYHSIDLEPRKKIIKKWLGKLGLEIFQELIVMKKADNLAQNIAQYNRQELLSEIERLAKEIICEQECFSLSDLAVSGGDLTEAGIPAGPEMGKMLTLLLEDVIEERVENKKEALLQYMHREYLKAAGPEIKTNF